MSKKFMIILMLALALAPVSLLRGEAPAADIKPVEDSEFVNARELFWSGRYDEAEVLLKKYLARKPDHEPTKVFLRMIHEERNFDPAQKKVIEKALDEVRFSHIEWNEMPLEKALEYLQKETKKQLPEGESIKFINLIPKSSETRKVTLNLEDSTLGQVVNQLSKSADVHHRIECEGIVFVTKAEI